MNSSVAEHSFLMKSAQAVRLRWLRRWPWYRVSRPPGEDPTDCWHCRHLNWTRNYTKNLAWESYRRDGCRVCSQCRQKRNRMTTSEHCLDMFKPNPKEFLRRFVTVDETWIHHYTPEMKDHQTVDYTRRTCSKEGENGSIGRKGHGLRFLAFARHHLHRLFGEGKVNHGAVLCWFIGPILVWIVKKRPHLAQKKVLFHHGNAPAHSSAIAIAKLVELRYELLPQPP